MMGQSLYIISDLHLGGAPASGGGRGFQICPPATQVALAAFIDRLPGRAPDRDCRLIIAGDIVDYLAEEPFEGFTADPVVARRSSKASSNTPLRSGRRCKPSCASATAR
jgi:hypothetical protein